MTKAERTALRRTHVEGWKPSMSVQIEVRVLKDLLDHLDELETCVRVESGRTKHGL